MDEIKRALKSYLEARASNLAPDTSVIDYADALADAIVKAGVTR